jgi:hypothetical protein
MIPHHSNASRNVRRRDVLQTVAVEAADRHGIGTIASVDGGKSGEAEERALLECLDAGPKRPLTNGVDSNSVVEPAQDGILLLGLSELEAREPRSQESE